MRFFRYKFATALLATSSELVVTTVVRMAGFQGTRPHGARLRGYSRALLRSLLSWQIILSACHLPATSGTCAGTMRPEMASSFAASSSRRSCVLILLLRLGNVRHEREKSALDIPLLPWRTPKPNVRGHESGGVEIA
jgi:hypothetical protein